MKSVKHHISRLPAFLLTAVMLIAIGWLTLAPRPLGETHVQLFPGADKWAHAILFGAFTIALLADRQRFSDWKRVTTAFALTAVAIATALGVGVEFLQRAMNIGRSFDVTDMIADFGGSILAALLYLFMQPRWSR